jgi:hypothetical protein
MIVMFCVDVIPGKLMGIPKHAPNGTSWNVPSEAVVASLFFPVALILGTGKVREF